MNESIICDRIALEVYPLIKSTRPYRPVIIYGLIITVLTISGILSNFAVILVTIWTKSFRGSVHILLAFYSLCEIVNLSGNFLSIFAAFSGHYFMPFKRAAYFMIIPFESAACAVSLMLFIGIGRLFVVLFPLKKFNHKIFLAIILPCNLIHVILITTIASICFDEKSNPIEIFANYYEIGQMIGHCFIHPPVGLISLILIVIIYALIALTLHCRKVPSNANSAHLNNRIFRSLFIILFVNLGGYLLAFSAIFVIQPMVHENAIVSWHIRQISGILMHISASSNGPILYLTSSEYHVAFQKTFAFFFKLLCIRAVVVPQN